MEEQIDLPVRSHSPNARSSNMTSDVRIRLQVGEKQFITSRATLTERSKYFASLLSGRWRDQSLDGSYFIDVDPGLFEHVLRFLRHGIYPLFYDQIKGHDFALYTAILNVAQYLDIPDLVQWLKEKEYLQAVRIRYSASQVDGISGLHAPVGSNIELIHYPEWVIDKVYVCPRGISRHRGSPDSCGRECRRVQGDADDMYEDEPCFRTLVVEKRTIFVDTPFRYSVAE